jgi:hypothetical protein
VASYGKGSGGPHSAHGEPAMFHGHGSKKDDVEIDVERFFRAVDRAIDEHYSKPSGLPLLLAALPEYHNVFRAVSKNPRLLPVGIETDPDMLSTEELRERAWQAIEPFYVKRLAEIVERYGAAKSRNRGTDDIEQAAQAAVAGRVETLLVEADRQIPGSINHTTGRITRGTSRKPYLDDMLDDLGELVLSRGGEVIVVPRERMPSESGLAAVYRF